MPQGRCQPRPRGSTTLAAGRGIDGMTLDAQGRVWAPRVPRTRRGIYRVSSSTRGARRRPWLRSSPLPEDPTNLHVRRRPQARRALRHEPSPRALSHLNTAVRRTGEPAGEVDSGLLHPGSSCTTSPRRAVHLDRELPVESADVDLPPEIADALFALRSSVDQRRVHPGRFVLRLKSRPTSNPSSIGLARPRAPSGISVLPPALEDLRSGSPGFRHLRHRDRLHAERVSVHREHFVVAHRLTVKSQLRQCRSR
jgi:hypothetical protein